MKEIGLIFGTRPEAIKMCPLLPALREEGFATRVAVSGQHRDMLDEALSDFGVTPDEDMHMMKEGQSPSDVLAAALTGTAAWLKKRKPDMALVHGDTATAYGAALACFLAHVPFGHVEAGLRTGDLLSPFPEELFRRAIAPMATLHFAPTAQARDNLLREGISAACITITGNTAIDALAMTQREDFTHPALSQAAGRRLILLTMHRRESLGTPMQELFSAVRELANRHEDVYIYCPLHPSPAVRACAAPLTGHPRILLGEPEGPLVFHNLLSRCYLVLTDSGGLQEEAPYFHKPVLVLREKTERQEGVVAGVLRLAGHRDSLLREATCLLCSEDAYRQMATAKSPFGDGKASRRIAQAIRRYWH
ncbi:MAG: UDP-N-acetylglucosamine 2-epimerase (non-hydrolyzing) [Clostridia bacterium]|nr:UDP-N-acetylglucosamine 2-epimerase (non-hydrolyzing) [Clostridia bacterium]